MRDAENSGLKQSARNSESTVFLLTLAVLEDHEMFSSCDHEIFSEDDSET